MILENRPNLYLVRHAESMQNVNQNLDRDSFLSEVGKKQATDAGVRLRSLLGDGDPGAIVHTGLRRTIDTAQAIKFAGGINAPLVEIPEFREREMGIYDRMEFSDLIRRNPYMELLYQQYRSSCVWFFDGSPGEGVEPLKEMKERIIRGLKMVQEHYVDQSAVVVAHAGSVKIIRYLYEEQPETDIAKYLCSYVPKNCEIYTLGEGVLKKQ